MAETTASRAEKTLRPSVSLNLTGARFPLASEKVQEIIRSRP